MLKTLRELRSVPHFYQLFLARTISNFGNGISPVALAFGVLGIAGADAASLSLVQFARTLPILLLLFVGGTLADKYGRARVMGMGDMLLSVLIMVIGISFILGWPSIWLLVVVGLLAGLLNGVWYPAFSGMIPIIVPEEKRQGANAALGFGSNIAFMLGTVSGGIVVATLGPGYALAVDAVTFFIAGALVYPLRKLPQPGQVTDGESISFVAELKLGWVEFKSRSWLVAIVVAFAFINAAVEALWAVLGALQAAETYGNGPAIWSLLLGAMSIGFLLGTIVANKMRPKHPLTILMLLMLALPVYLFTYATGQAIWLVFIAAAAMGIAQDVFYVMWSTVIQQNIPEDKLSRVTSYDTFGSFLIGPLGMLVAGPLAIIYGVSTTMLWAAGLSLVAIVGALLVPSVRKLELRIHD